MRPSSERAHLAMTKGRPATIHLLKARLRASASAARMPGMTSMPAARSRSRPRPAWEGLGSTAPMTTRANPAAMMASTQGGVRP